MTQYQAITQQDNSTTTQRASLSMKSSSNLDMHHSSSVFGHSTLLDEHPDTQPCPLDTTAQSTATTAQRCCSRPAGPPHFSRSPPPCEKDQFPSHSTSVSELCGTHCSVLKAVQPTKQHQSRTHVPIAAARARLGRATSRGASTSASPSPKAPTTQPHAQQPPRHARHTTAPTWSSPRSVAAVNPYHKPNTMGFTTQARHVQPPSPIKLVQLHLARGRPDHEAPPRHSAASRHS